MAHAETATGSIDGRVMNVQNGTFMSKARVTVEGTALEAFTNDFGEYHLPVVPAGEAKLRVRYTGQKDLAATVTVVAGKSVMRDFEFGTEADATVKLSKFVVETERFKTAEELATNEERYSVNLKNVVATDAFGHIPDGNLGEFVKYLPGVETEYGDVDAFAGAGLGGVNQASASQISIRGFGAADTAITVDGMPLAGISPAGLTRAVGLDMISLNNASRIEIVKVPTPDMVANSGGGVVNLVSKSAFEYSRPAVTIGANLTFNTEEGLHLSKTPGPANKKTYHTLPSGSVSVVYPFSKTLGLSVNVASANSYSPNKSISTTWRNTTTVYSRIPTNNPTPTTAVVNLAGDRSDLAHPFLRQATVVDNPWSDYKQSASFKLDWRPSPRLNLSGTYSLSTYTGINASRRLQVSAEQPYDWGATYVIGRKYEAATTNPTVAALDPGNKAAMEVTTRDRRGFTHQGGLKVEYRVGQWTFDTLLSMSEAYGEFRDLKNKHFASIALSMTGLGQVIMKDIEGGSPGSVQIFDRSGNPLDYTRLSNWTLDNATTLNVGTTKSFQRDKTAKYQANVRRDFTFARWGINAGLKAGAAKDIKEQRKWGLGTGYKMRYTGPTLTNADVLDTSYEAAPGFGFTQPQQWADTYKLYDVYVAHPEYFNADFDVPMSRDNYRTEITQTKSIKSVTDNWYAQAESRYFHNRLSVVFGVNKSETKNTGRQPFTDSKWNYVKNPDGTVYTDSVYPTGIKFDGSNFTNASGQTVRDVILTDTALQGRLKTAGVSYPDHLILGPGGATGTTANTMEAVRRQYYTRYLEQRVDNPIRPSIITSFNVFQNLTARASWNRTTTLAPLDGGNGGTVGILGTYSINETLPRAVGAGGEGTITVSNPALKPKTTDSYNFGLSYYTKNGGQLSGTYYLTKTKNNWESADVFNTDQEYAQILNTLGLDPASFEDWKITTTVNGDERSSSTGYELSLRQNLGLIHRWGQPFTVFANYSHKNIKQSTKANVVGQIALSAANTWGAGVNFSLKRFSATAKLTYKNAVYTRGGTINYLAPGTTAAANYQMYSYSPDEYKVDIDVDYQLSKRYSIWANGRNVLNTERDRYSYDLATGYTPEYARITSNQRFGIQIAVGVTAKF